MDVALWIALVGLLTNVATATVAIRTVRGEKTRTAVEHRKAKALEELATLQTKISQGLQADVTSLKEEVANLKQQLGRRDSLATVKAMELEDRKQREEWKRAKDLARGLGWLLNSDGR